MKRRIRRAARVVLRRGDGRILLFRFSYEKGVLAGQSYWALPGGGLEGCETPSEGAVRELREETGLVVAGVGEVRLETEYDMTLMNGEEVRQHDYYFVVSVEGDAELSREGFTEEELETMVESRWWERGELASSADAFMPVELADTVLRAGGFETA